MGLAHRDECVATIPVPPHAQPDTIFMVSEFYLKDTHLPRDVVSLKMAIRVSNVCFWEDTTAAAMTEMVKGFGYRQA